MAQLVIGVIEMYWFCLHPGPPRSFKAGLPQQVAVCCISLFEKFSGGQESENRTSPCVTTLGRLRYGLVSASASRQERSAGTSSAAPIRGCDKRASREPVSGGTV